MQGLPQIAVDAGGGFAAKARELVGVSQQLIDKHGTGLFRHGVVPAGEHIHRCIARFGPGVDGDVRFGQQGQPRDALGFETVGDQVEQGCTGTLCCCGDGGPEEKFVVELGAVATVELENAMFPNGVGNLVGEGGQLGGSLRGPRSIPGSGGGRAGSGSSKLTEQANHHRWL